MIKPLTEYCLVTLRSNISQFDEFPNGVPSAVLEMIFQRLTEKRAVTPDILNLFIRSPMQVFNIQRTKVSGITIDSPTSCVTVLRIDNAPFLQQLYIHKAEHLKVLSISKCPRLDTLFITAPNLSTICLPDIYTKDNAVKNILLECSANFVDVSGCLQLQSCTLSMPLLDSLDLSANRNITHLNITCHELKTLDISKLYELEDVHIKGNALVNLEVDFKSQLRELNVESSSLSKLSIKRCPMLTNVEIKCENLKNLEVSHQNPVGSTSSNIRLLAHALQDLSFTNSKDLGVRLEDYTLGKHNNAIKLRLSNCVGLTDPQLVKLLQSLSNVQWLDLSNTAISDVILLELPRLCPNLETLNLTGTSVSVPGVQEFSKRVNLSRYCFISNGELQHILSTSEENSKLIL